MRRPSYRSAIIWIAENDEPTEKNLDEVSSMISVQLIAHLFGKSDIEVAEDIIILRNKRE